MPLPKGLSHGGRSYLHGYKRMRNIRYLLKIDMITIDKLSTELSCCQVFAIINVKTPKDLTNASAIRGTPSRRTIELAKPREAKP